MVNTFEFHGGSDKESLWVTTEFVADFVEASLWFVSVGAVIEI